MKHSDPRGTTILPLNQRLCSAVVRRLIQPPSGWTKSSASSPSPPQEEERAGERRPRLLKAALPARSSRGEGESFRGFCHAASLDLRLLFVTLFLLQFASDAQVSNIYSTGFEFSEGFDIQHTLMGQGGWTGTDPSGSGNGIVKD